MLYYKRAQGLPLRNKGHQVLATQGKLSLCIALLLLKKLHDALEYAVTKLWISQKPEYIFDWLYIKGNSPQHGARQV